MARDRESIGLTTANQSVLDLIMEQGWFSQAQDAARFCMAYAIREGIVLGSTEGTETRWAAGNFDKTGELRAVIMALYPETHTPVRLMEHFVNAGLDLIAAKFQSGDLRASDLLGIPLAPSIGESAAPVGDRSAARPDSKIIPLDAAEVAHERYLSLLPVYSLRAAAGYFGQGQAVDPEGWVEATGIGPLDDRMFVARAVGRSMEPRIRDGDLLVFRRDPVGTRQGMIVLAEHRGHLDPETGGAYTVKKYSSEKQPDTSSAEWRHSRIVLSPTNPDYKPIVLTPKDENDFRVVAEFISVLNPTATADHE